MNILMVGTGYVGLVTAACLSDKGHHVICVDIDEQKIAHLQQGILPIFEPGLEEIVIRNVAAGRLSFTTHYAEGVKQSTLCFIAVPTPTSEDNSCDLSYFYAAASSIASHINGHKIIVNKSTVPIGTAHQVKQLIAAVLRERKVEYTFDIVSNPEFLKEGSAISDCMTPDRIVLGIENSDAAKTMRELYSLFNVHPDDIFVMDTASAEMTKYAANAMLALRISFMNELAHLCEKMGADIKQVRIGIGSDQRIGNQFLHAGAGYGGSCFPKDIRALASIAKQRAVDMPILNAIEEINQRQKRVLAKKILAYFSSQGGIQGKTLAVWGLSFKPNTDDIREAPSLTLISELLGQGALIRAYDPVAMPNASKFFKDSITLCKDECEAALHADAIVLVTEWQQFRSVDFSKIIPFLKQKVFFDGRNQYPLSSMEALGLEYYGIGVPSSRHDLHSIIDTVQKNSIHQEPSIV
jgi:UDPglucose 6-dehydrogenase